MSENNNIRANVESETTIEEDYNNHIEETIIFLSRCHDWMVTVGDGEFDMDVEGRLREDAKYGQISWSLKFEAERWRIAGKQLSKFMQ